MCSASLLVTRIVDLLIINQHTLRLGYYSPSLPMYASINPYA